MRSAPLLRCSSPLAQAEKLGMHAMRRRHEVAELELDYALASQDRPARLGATPEASRPMLTCRREIVRIATSCLPGRRSKLRPDRRMMNAGRCATISEKQELGYI